MAEVPATPVAAAPAAGLQARLRVLLAPGFIRNVGETYLTHIAKIALGLVTSVLISRLLGPAGRGIFAVAVAVGAVGVQFANLGLHSSNTYFVARDRKLAGVLAGNSLLVSFGYGSLLAVVLWALFTAMPTLLAIGGAVLVLAVVAIPIGLAYLLLTNLLLGVHDVRGYNAGELTARAVPLVLLVPLALRGDASVLAVLVVSTLGPVCAGAYIYRRLTPHVQPRPSLSLGLFRENLQYGTKAYLASLFAFLVLRSDLFLVQHIRGPVETGYYSIAASMADMIALLAVSVATMLFPKVSAISDVQEKLRLTWKATAGTAVMMAPMLGVGCLLAKPVIHLLYGKAFLPAAPAFILLAPGMFFLCIHAVAVQFLNSIGYPKAVVVIWGVCTALNVGLNLWAIPRWGMLGAAVVSSICYTLAALAVLAIMPLYARIMTEKS